MDTYKGDSWAKKISREWWWTRAEVQRVARHICFGSRDGGDISCLLGTGISADRILAVERDRAAADACANKWPGVEVRCASIEDAIRGIKSCEPVSVFLDFCNELCAELVTTAVAVINAIPVGSQLAIGMIRGREKDGRTIGGCTPKRNNLQRRALRSMLRLETRRSSSRVVDGIADAVLGQRTSAGTIHRWTLDDSKEAKIAGRVFALREAITCHAAFSGKRYPHLKGGFLYQSATEASKGVPMIIGAFEILREERRVDWANVRTQFYEAPGDWEEARDSVKRACLAIGDGAHLLYNLPKRVVCAWKAHESRGTYRITATA